MRPLQVHIDVNCSTATPAQPDPQTIHLNAAQAKPSPAGRAMLLQAVDIPAESARLVRYHNPWPSEDVYFCPAEGLPTFVSGVPALTSGTEVWVAIHNHRPEPLRLHTGQAVGTLEVVALADPPPPPTPSSKQPGQQDKEKTAFRTSSGQLFEFNQVPFGLCNAPATFSRLMDRVLAGLHWETCLFYLDNIIVFAATWKEHLARLRQVFERLRQAKLKLGAEKCTFAANEVNYLGHRVTSEGLLPDPALLKAIHDIEPPRNATKVRSFLGLAGYYRRYVKNFAAIAGPLHALTRKDAVFHWSNKCQQAFNRLKTLLTTSPITAFPDFNLSFRLYTDASTAGLGAILVQIQDGKERIICCASCSLNQAKKAYPTTSWSASPSCGPLPSFAHI